MTATTEATAPLAEIWNQARGRLEARRNQRQGYSEAERRKAWVEARELPRDSLYAPEFREPSSVAEFFDDRVLERDRQFWDLPETPLLLEVADAARESADAAVRAVRAARRLDVRVQWVIYQNLVLWKGGNKAATTGADRIVSAVLGEWSRLRLTAEDPDGE